MHIDLADAMSLVSTTHVKHPTTACNSKLKGSDTLLWPLQAPVQMCTFRHIYM